MFCFDNYKPLEIYFNHISFKLQNISLKKINLKMSPANGGHFVQDPLYWRLQIFCLACILATDSYYISVGLEGGVAGLNRMISS